MRAANQGAVNDSPRRETVFGEREAAAVLCAARSRAPR